MVAVWSQSLKYLQLWKCANTLNKLSFSFYEKKTHYFWQIQQTLPTVLPELRINSWLIGKRWSLPIQIVYWVFGYKYFTLLWYFTGTALEFWSQRGIDLERATTKTWLGGKNSSVPGNPFYHLISVDVEKSSKNYLLKTYVHCCTRYCHSRSKYRKLTLNFKGTVSRGLLVL